MGQKKLVVSVVMILIFTMAILNYSIGFASDNDASFSIADDDSFGQLTTDVQTFSAGVVEEGNDTDVGFFQRKTESEDELIKTGGSLKDMGRISSSKALLNITGSIQNAIFGGKGSEFGIVFSLLGILFIMIIALYVYKTIKGGNPD